MSRRNHEIHAQQRTQGKDIELSLLDRILVTAQIAVRHQEHDKRTYVERGFHNRHHRRVQVHASECFGRLAARHGINYRKNCHQHHRNGSVEARLAGFPVGANNEVVNKHYDYHSQQCQLFVHIKKLCIVHVLRNHKG